MVRAGTICGGYEFVSGMKWIYKKPRTNFKPNEKRMLTLMGMCEIKRIAQETREGSAERNERMKRVWEQGAFPIE